MKSELKEYVLPAGAIAVSAAIIAIYYPHLPSQIPTHWGITGQADQFGPKWPSAFAGPALSAGTLLLFELLPRLDPLRENYCRFRPAYHILRNVIVLYMCFAGLVPVLVAAGLVSETGPLVMASAGLLFAIIGNYMGRLRRNWYAGIKTPWTLSSETVWNKTHRLGGKLWFMAGLIGIVSATVPKPWGPIAFAAAVTLGAVIPVVYSYFVFREEARQGSPPIE